MSSNICNKKITSVSLPSKKRISVEINSNLPINIEKLSSLQLEFVAVTWIGNFRNRNFEEIPPVKLAKRLIQEGKTVLLHIPCRNFNKNQALNLLNFIKDIGIRNILALKGQSRFIEDKDDSKVDFPYASNFVEFVKQNFNDLFAIGVAGYPEKHPHSVDIDEDMRYLSLKVLKGVDFIVTQASFEYSTLQKFYERCQMYSIQVPVFVGATILTSFNHLEMLKHYCKISVTKDISQFVEVHKDKEEYIQSFSKQKLIKFGEEILSESSVFGGIHIFLMNNNVNLLADLLMELNKIHR